MRRLFLVLLLGFISCVIAVPAAAQDYKKMRAELVEKQQNTRKEIQNINEQISQYQERLNLAQEKYERLFKKYEDQRRIIALQEEKISKLKEEQRHISDEIQLTQKQIDHNEQRLAQLIKNYKKTLTYIYKHGRESQLALIFSSSSINQMLIRAFYLNKFETYRENQAREIHTTQEELKRNKTQLEQAREKNTGVLKEIESEKSKQQKQVNKQKENVTLLRRNRKRIKEKLNEVRQQKERLNNTLTSLILEEERVRKAQEERIQRLEEERKRKLAEARTIKDDAERAREVAKYSKPIAPKEFVSKKKLDEVGASFADDKGKLPWPVESSTISEHFGRRRHPIYGTETPNLGIEIVTKARQPVRVVHDGYVIDVQPLTGYGDVVVVRHGQYFTAYGNLSKVMVRKDSILKEGDIIGLSGDENSAKGRSVFFMVRHKNTNEDPEKWLVHK